MTRELKVVSDFYDLIVYLARRIEKFPRHHRHSLGVDIEHRLQGILASLIGAKYAAQKDQRVRFLGEVNTELEVLRFQLRLARDLAALPNQGHGHAIDLMSQVGTQVGGWLKSLRPGANQATHTNS